MVILLTLFQLSDFLIFLIFQLSQYLLHKHNHIICINSCHETYNGLFSQNRVAFISQQNLMFSVISCNDVLMHGVHYGSGPKYLAEMVVPISSLPGRERLRSAGSLNYDICRTRLKFTEHSFAVSGPTAWSSLPLELKQTSNAMKFKKLLKSHLFLLAYSKLF